MNKFILIFSTLFIVASCDKGSNDELSYPDIDPDTQTYSPYISAVFDYVPAPGQYVNTMPAYSEGQTKQDILDTIEAGFVGTGSGTMITLGGFGGYVVFGFDHTIENKEGLCDFRINGNAYSGSSEPGIILVAQDTNGNGLPDDTWYQIKGSAHDDPSTINNYTITYTRAESEDQSPYILWSDNQGTSGSIEKNVYHSQSYFPQWIEDSQITFTGVRLPDVAVNTAESGEYWQLSEFAYGYADNAANTADNSAIDISWAIDDNGDAANLGGIDFVKVYNSQNQVAGWLGEISTDICGAEDLHLLEIEILSEDITK